MPVTFRVMVNLRLVSYPRSSRKGRTHDLALELEAQKRWHHSLSEGAG